MKKGLTNFEFVLSVFVFLTVISFVTVTIVYKIPNIHQNYMGESLKSRGYYISHVLLLDEGFPSDWDTNPPALRYGLASTEPYILDSDKVTALGAICSANREYVKKIMGDFAVNITDLDGNEIMYCKTDEPTVELKIRRAAVLNSQLVSMEVVGW